MGMPNKGERESRAPGDIRVPHGRENSAKSLCRQSSRSNPNASNLTEIRKPNSGARVMNTVFIGPIAAAVLLLLCPRTASGQASFKPAQVTEAHDVAIPPQSVADGVIVVDVYLNEKGTITQTSVVRDVSSLSSSAVASIESWKFAPALRQGKPEPSVMRIAVAFRPRAYFVADTEFDPVQNQSEMSAPVPGILATAYPHYPINAVAGGAVVIQVTVSRSNQVDHVSVVRNAPPFAPAALSAIKNWRFQAATLDGKPLTSILTVAFVFSPPLSN
jgi:TonB family protein